MDVWEVVATICDNDGNLSAVAEMLGIALALVEAAAAYYAEHLSEMDALISDNERAATEGYAQWRAGHDTPRA